MSLKCAFALNSLTENKLYIVYEDSRRSHYNGISVFDLTHDTTHKINYNMRAKDTTNETRF